MTPNGLIVRPSAHGPDETLKRLDEAIRKRGIAVVVRIDHTAAAMDVGLELRPTTVLIFGNPVVGTPLMQIEQTMGIDLPLKALVWQDAEQKTWLAYNDPAWLARRHGVEAVRGVDAMTKALEVIAQEATAPG